MLLLPAALVEELSDGMMEEEGGRGGGVDNALVGLVDRLPEVV